MHAVVPGSRREEGCVRSCHVHVRWFLVADHEAIIAYHAGEVVAEHIECDFDLTVIGAGEADDIERHIMSKAFSNVP